jgi:predicted dehydrogenase
MMEKVKDKEICWGIIGAGSVCQVKSAPAMNKIPGSRIAAVMRRNGEKAREFAARHGVPQWYDDADALLADPDVNAVYIATPPGSHRELTLKAAAAGKPVYVEKPMARTWQECRDMIAACEEAGVPLFVAYYRRMLPNYRKIKELVDGDVIGTVRTVHIKMSRPVKPDVDMDPANWRVQPEHAGGGYFYDLASHQIDFLDYLLGPVSEACGFASNQAGLYPAEDTVTGTFRFENGAHGTGNWCFCTAASDEEDLITLTGSKGVLSWPTFAGYYVDLKTDAGTDTLRFHFDMPEHIQQPLIGTIVRELQDFHSGRHPMTLINKALINDTMEGNSSNPTASEILRCPSTGVTAARTNRVMEVLTGVMPMNNR